MSPIPPTHHASMPSHQQPDALPIDPTDTILFALICLGVARAPSYSPYTRLAAANVLAPRLRLGPPLL